MSVLMALLLAAFALAKTPGEMISGILQGIAEIGSLKFLGLNSGAGTDSELVGFLRVLIAILSFTIWYAALTFAASFTNGAFKRNMIIAISLVLTAFSVFIPSEIILTLVFGYSSIIAFILVSIPILIVGGALILSPTPNKKIAYLKAAGCAVMYFVVSSMSGMMDNLKTAKLPGTNIGGSAIGTGAVSTATDMISVATVVDWAALFFFLATIYYLLKGLFGLDEGSDGSSSGGFLGKSRSWPSWLGGSGGSSTSPSTSSTPSGPETPGGSGSGGSAVPPKKKKDAVDRDKADESETILDIELSSKIIDQSKKDVEKLVSIEAELLKHRVDPSGLTEKQLEDWVKEVEGTLGKEVEEAIKNMRKARSDARRGKRDLRGFRKSSKYKKLIREEVDIWAVIDKIRKEFEAIKKDEENSIKEVKKFIEAIERNGTEGKGDFNKTQINSAAVRMKRLHQRVTQAHLDLAMALKLEQELLKDEESA